MSYEQHTPLAPKSFFNENNDRFRLLCCHVRTWALVIGTLEIIWAFISLGWEITSYSVGEDSTIYHTKTVGGLIWGILQFVVWIVIASLMIYGVKRENHLLLIPHIVLQILSIIGCIIYAIIFFIVAAAVGFGKSQQKGEVAGVVIGAGIVMLIIAAVEIFFVYVIIRCYRFLREKRLAAEAAAYVPMAANYETIGKAV